MSKNKHGIPGFGNRFYNFIPAAVNYRVTPMTVYVAYGKHAPRVELKEVASNYCWIRCPDRDLILTIGFNSQSSYRPMSGNFDEMHVFSPFHEESWADHGVDWFMMNYTEFMGGEDSPNVRSHPRKKRVNIVSDSGGFQIFRGSLEYLDPLKLVDWYNNNVDLGMTLDIPSRAQGEDIYKRLAKIQKHNNKVIMDNKREDLEIFNIFHGTTPEETKMYRSIVERPDIDRLAMGGLYLGTTMGSAYKLVNVLLDGMKYKHYHILGVQNLTQVLPLIWTSIRYGVNITSDSSTWLKRSVYKVYMDYSSLAVAPSNLNIGTMNANKYDSVGYITSTNQLACNCNMCSVIKYRDVFAVITNLMTTQAISYHNMLTTVNYMKDMYDVMSKMTLDQVKELVTVQFGEKMSGKGSSALNDMLRVFTYVDDVKEMGLKDANKKWKFYVDTGTKKVSQSSLLDRTSEKQDEEKCHAMTATLAYVERYEKAIRKEHVPEHGKGIKQDHRKTSSKRIMNVTPASSPKKFFDAVRAKLSKHRRAK